MQGFPIGQTGSYTVRARVEEKEQRVVGPIEFKIELEVIRQPGQSFWFFHLRVFPRVAGRSST
jgi:hypothetical protein